MPPISSSKSISKLKLFRIASYIGLIGSSSVLLMKWIIDRRLRRSDYFIRATEELLSYQPIVDLLGPPIYFGNPNLTDKRNYSTEKEAQFMIPLAGSKNKGIMYMKATREIDLDRDILPPLEPNVISVPSTLPNPMWSIKEMYVSINNRPGERVRIPVNQSTNYYFSQPKSTDDDNTSSF